MKIFAILVVMIFSGCASSQPENRKPDCFAFSTGIVAHEVTAENALEDGPCSCGLDKDNDGFLDSKKNPASNDAVTTRTYEEKHD